MVSWLSAVTACKVIGARSKARQVKSRRHRNRMPTPLPPWKCYSATTIGMIDRKCCLRCYKTRYRVQGEVLHGGELNR
jgi:hypothetical protein